MQNSHKQTSTRAHLVDYGVRLARGQQEEDYGEEEEEQLRQAILSDASASGQQGNYGCMREH